MKLLSRFPELPFLLIALVVLNAHLLPGVGTEPLVFLPALAFDGEWWRFLTHPFVHITCYHLVLDGLAFFILYGSLEARRPLARLGYLFGSATGSLGLALASAPQVQEIGLCGLSGTAHGLLTVSGLEAIRRGSVDRAMAVAGWTSVLLVGAKSLYELFTGTVLLSFLESSIAGTPIAASHAGGVLGGVLVYTVVRARRTRGPAPVHTPIPPPSTAKCPTVGPTRSSISSSTISTPERPRG